MRDRGGSRNRFARRQWARRWVAWRYLVAGGLLLALVIGGGYTVYVSSVLDAEAVEVTGAEALSEEQVLRAADVPLGGPLARVDLDRIALRVRSLAEVESADVTRRWPHEVRIEIVERTPVAVIEIGERLHHLDGDGVVFGRLKRAPADLPKVVTTAATDEAAITEAAQVVAALPEEVSFRVERIEVETVDQITLALRDGREVLWGNAADSDQKAEVLATLLQRDARSYDVSVPGNPTIS